MSEFPPGWSADTEYRGLFGPARYAILVITHPHGFVDVVRGGMGPGGPRALSVQDVIDMARDEWARNWSQHDMDLAQVRHMLEFEEGLELRHFAETSFRSI